jgi:hypothetical protein
VDELFGSHHRRGSAQCLANLKDLLLHIYW